MKKAVLILSGGLDSSTLAYYLVSQGYELIAVSFNYGQKHNKELLSASTIANNLQAKHYIIDISHVKELLTNTSLVSDDLAIPDGHYSAKSMASTVVPNRNSLMLNYAWMIACNESAHVVAFGAQSGDRFSYPDCREEFLVLENQALRSGTDGCRLDELQLIAPFITFSKSDIVKQAVLLNVPIKDTWTCYKGQEFHCGTCGACVGRREGFSLAGIPDPTIYKE